MSRRPSGLAVCLHPQLHNVYGEVREMDYEKLLRKYIRHVMETEGEDFIDPPYVTGVHFTEEELVILQRIHDGN
jgi:hypothetical protein